MRHINLVDNVIVERFRRDDAGFRQPRVQQALLKSRDKAAEDVARTEVDPDGVLLVFSAIFAQSYCGSATCAAA